MIVELVEDQTLEMHLLVGDMDIDASIRVVSVGRKRVVLELAPMTYQGSAQVEWEREY